MPDLLILLIDGSGSMGALQKQVIDAQRAAINALRDSAAASSGTLYISQLMFNDTTTDLHVNPRSNPRGGYVRLGLQPQTCGVTLLSNANYQPAGQTRLYGTIVDACTSIMQYRTHNPQVQVTVRLGLITDGMDNIGFPSKTADEAAQIARDALRECFAQELLVRATLVGLVGAAGLSKVGVDTLRQTLGFTHAFALSTDGDDATRAIMVRRAFALASN